MRLSISPSQIRVLTWLDTGERPQTKSEWKTKASVLQSLACRGLVETDCCTCASLTGLGFSLVEDFYRGAFHDLGDILIFNV